MQWTIPGTVLSAPRAQAGQIEEQFRAMFLPGGMVLSQVSAITGLDGYIVQNWVKRGFLTRPENKHYSLRQLCRIININMLKSVLPIDRICSLLGYVNGRLDDEADDMIDESEVDDLAHAQYTLERLSIMIEALQLCVERKIDKGEISAKAYEAAYRKAESRK